VSASGENGHSIRSPTAGHSPKLAAAGYPVALGRSFNGAPVGVLSSSGLGPRQSARRKVVERPGPATSGRGGGGARNRMLASLPKPALVSNGKVPSIGAFSRTMSASGGKRHASAGRRLWVEWRAYLVFFQTCSRNSKVPGGIDVAAVGTVHDRTSSLMTLI